MRSTLTYNIRRNGMVIFDVDDGDEVTVDHLRAMKNMKVMIEKMNDIIIISSTR
jgi:hypothetical protein